jgi:phosphocarrier protein HPr
MCIYEEIVTLLNKVGLHARPAAMFVQTASKYKSKIKISKEEKEVDAKSILGVLSLAAFHNDKIKIKAEGEDAEEALKQLIDLVNNKFGEE